MTVNRQHATTAECLPKPWQEECSGKLLLKNEAGIRQPLHPTTKRREDGLLHLIVLDHWRLLALANHRSSIDTTRRRARNAPMKHTHHHIQEGQRFLTPEGMEWEVSSFVVTRRDEPPHVALVKPLDRLTRKVVAVDALFDKRFFNVIDSSDKTVAEAEDETNH